MTAPSGPLGPGQDLRSLGDNMLSRVAATPSKHISSATTTVIYAVNGNKIFVVFRLFALNMDGSDAVTLDFKSESTSILGPLVLQPLGSAGDRIDLLGGGLPLLIALAEGDDFQVTTSSSGTVNVLISAAMGVRTPGLT